MVDRGASREEETIARIREVYPTDKPKCPWCGVKRGKHNFDCPSVDVNYLLGLVAEASARPAPPLETHDDA